MLRALGRKGLYCCAEIDDTVLSLLQEENCNVVYFFYGKGDTLLYVGKTDNFPSRWAQHNSSEKEMGLVQRVALHLFASAPEMLFYEAQQIIKQQPQWNKSGINDKPSIFDISPLSVVWFDRKLRYDEQELDGILESMSVYYSNDWFARHTDEQLAEEVERIVKLKRGLIDRERHIIYPPWDNVGLPQI